MQKFPGPHGASYDQEDTPDIANEFEDRNYVDNPINASVSSIKSKEVEVLSIHELKIADQVKFIRLWGYSHHAIVENIDISTNIITVMEYTSRENLNFSNKGVIKSSKYNFAEFSMLNKFIYDDDVDDNLVLQRARSKIGEERYSMIFNNCEHFACWCRTGINKSLQVEDFANSGITSAFIGGLSTLTKKFAPTILAEIVEKYSVHIVGAGIAAGFTVLEAIYELYKLINDCNEGKFSFTVFKDYLITWASEYSFSVIAIVVAVFITCPTTIPASILSGIFVTFSGIFGKYFGKCFGTYVNNLRRNWSDIIVDFKDKIIAAQDAVGLRALYINCKDALLDFIKWLLGY